MKQQRNGEPEEQAKAILAAERAEIEKRTRRLKELRLAREAAGLGPIGKWERTVRVAQRMIDT